MSCITREGTNRRENQLSKDLASNMALSMIVEPVKRAALIKNMIQVQLSNSYSILLILLSVLASNCQILGRCTLVLLFYYVKPTSVSNYSPIDRFSRIRGPNRLD